jgi:hypothetical protein
LNISKAKGAKYTVHIYIYIYILNEKIYNTTPFLAVFRRVSTHEGLNQSFPAGLEKTSLAAGVGFCLEQTMMAS